MNHYLYRQDWTAVLQLLNQSLHAEEMVCSMSTQLFHIPAAANIKGNAEMHNHLVPASYHRVTAAGSALRLRNGETHASIIQTLTSCVNNALRQDQEVMKGLRIMRDNAPNPFRSTIEIVIRWQQQAEQSLTSAKQLLTQMVFETQDQYQSQ
ncbi:hypothetical protein [Fictibacillus terranigra]|uniref:Uncharacterized protein n=1 Tax=Fictibacillus terranigra TaxID=3058424 RepID=A0ABT8EAJ3_9BACL|nr:hypothetical protein [Fictibacillus sp. CENA-BCM004]MDN4074940.1 hypothetical protein [Fictibacillus sp. CENA-BCM004]